MLHSRAYLAVIVTILISASSATAGDPLFSNSGFELGNLDNWTQTVGTAWRTATTGDFAPFFTNAPEGAFLASTFFPAGTIPEPEQATLKSINFTVPAGKDMMEFYIAGWNDASIHVDIKKVSDDSVVWSQTVPATNASFVRVTKNGFLAYAGQELYIEAIDQNVGGDPAAVSGWLGVDGFAWAAPIATEGALFPNSGFEYGDFTNWTQTVGTAFEVGSNFTPFFATAPEGNFAASTYYPQGRVLETEQATIRSITFTVPAQKDVMQFYISGWFDPYIHVDVKKASDNSVVWTQKVPSTSANFVKVQQAGFSAYVGQALYIEAIDENVGGDPAAASGWMGVDGFAWGTALPPCNTPENLAFPNADFESGDFTNWTVSGDAFAVSTATWPSDGWQCNYHGTSFTQESLMGSLQSINFKLTKKQISFKIGGWSHTPENDESWNYVTLNRASDGAEIDRVLAPGITGTMATEYLDGTSVVGQNVYIMVVDESDGGGYSWITVDAFVLVDGPPICPTLDGLAFANADFETGDLTGWTVTGDAFSVVGTVWPSDGYHCNFLASSFPTGEPRTGTIQSPAFKLTDTGVNFRIGGWRDRNDGGGENWNYVTLHRASDNTELDRVLAPNVTGTMKFASLNGTAALNQNVYVKVTDDASEGGFSWISVDAFAIGTYIPPENFTWPITITKVATPPVIDGNINVGTGLEWSGSLPLMNMRLSTLNIPDPYAPTFVHNGGVYAAGGTITNDADASALYYFAWDNNALYMAADVTDESINPNVIAGAMNGGDAFQACLDYDQVKVTDADISGSVYIPTIAAAANVGTAPADGSSPNFNAFWPTTSPNPMTGTQWGVTVTAGSGYKVEVKIPWTAFTAGGDAFTNPFPPVVGQKMGLLLMIDDHDGGVGAGTAFMFAAGGGAGIWGRADQYPEATFGPGITAVDNWSLY